MAETSLPRRGRGPLDDFVRREREALSLGAVLTGLFLLVSPLVDVFAPVIWLAPPMVVGVAMTGWLASRGQVRIDASYGLMLVLVCIVCVPWIFSIQYVSRRTLLHAAIILLAASVYYLGLRSGLQELTQRRGMLAVLKIVFVATGAVSAFILLEFLGANLRIGNIAAAIPRVSSADFAALAFGVVYRARGTASEPGVMALYFDLALFLALPVLRQGWPWRLVFFSMIVPGYLCLLSTGSLVCVLAGAGLLVSRNLGDRFLRTSGLLLMAAFLAIAVWLAAGAQAGEVLQALVLDRIDSLANDAGEDGSGAARRDRFLEIGRVFVENPLGIGFGITPGLADVSVSLDGQYASEGQISLPGTLLVAGGLPAVTLALVILGMALRKAWSVPEYGRYLAAGGFALSAHHLTVSEYWLPFIWMFLALAGAWHSATSTEDAQPATES